MLVGFDLVKCVSDIMENKVHTSQVEVIITDAYVEYHNINDIVDRYQKNNGPWYDYDKDKINLLLRGLWKHGRLHVIKKYGDGDRIYRKKHWMTIVSNPEDMPKAALDAWDKFVLLASLSGYRSKND